MCICLENPNARKDIHCAICKIRWNEDPTITLLIPDYSVIEKLKRDAIISDECTSKKICTKHYRHHQLRHHNSWKKLKDPLTAPTLQLIELNISSIPFSKRRHSIGEESNESDGSQKKKSKFSGYQQIVRSLESIANEEGFERIQKTVDTFKFVVKGNDGILFSMEVKETKATVRAFFIYTAESIVIELLNREANEEIISKLQSFLTRARKINKKEELFDCPNWNDFRIESPSSATQSSNQLTTESSSVLPNEFSSQSVINSSLTDHSSCDAHRNELPSIFEVSSQFRGIHPNLQSTQRSVVHNDSTGGSLAAKSSSSVPLRPCVKCGLQTNNHECSGCGDFYCSVECQGSDWQNHRHFCYKMPDLVTPIE